MRRLAGMLVMLFALAVTCLPASAGQSEWKDPAYAFGKVKTVMITAYKFSYDGYDTSGKDRFVKYPYAEEKIAGMLNSRFKKVASLRYVTMDYVKSQVKGNPSFPANLEEGSKEFTAYLQREMPKYVDLIMFVEIRDFGWFHKYRPAHYTTETVTQRVEYHGRTPEGKEYSGWMDVPRTEVVFHDASYEIYDSAEINFGLVDTRTGNSVWKYGDSRSRSSFSWNKAYDQSGPESVMNRILDDAFKKMPIVPKEEEPVPVYN